MQNAISLPDASALFGSRRGGWFGERAAPLAAELLHGTRSQLSPFLGVNLGVSLRITAPCHRIPSPFLRRVRCGWRHPAGRLQFLFPLSANWPGPCGVALMQQNAQAALATRVRNSPARFLVSRLIVTARLQDHLPIFTASW